MAQGNKTYQDLDTQTKVLSGIKSLMSFLWDLLTRKKYRISADISFNERETRGSEGSVVSVGCDDT